MIDKIFIIHQSKNTTRCKYIQDLIHTYPNYEIIEPIIPKDLSIYGGRRRNNKYITAELSLTLTNLFILNKIIKSKLNKSAIYVGGGLQLLFGVMGKRWENNPMWIKIIKDNDCKFIRPSGDEIIINKKPLESGGCYW